jgi:hypothetical protein
VAILFVITSEILKDNIVFALKHPHYYSENEMHNECECACLYKIFDPHLGSRGAGMNQVWVGKMQHRRVSTLICNPLVLIVDRFERLVASDTVIRINKNCVALLRKV